jgi:ABC-type Na+ efflux pump permease subunit
MAVASFLLERWSAVRLFRRFGRPLPIAALVLALTCAIALTATGPAASGSGANKGYCLLVWGEFLLILVVTLVESGSSIAEERRHGTWDAILLTDLSAGELARGKLLGSLLTPALLVLLAIPAHLAFGFRSPESWPMIAGVQTVLAGTALAVAGFGVVASSWTDRALQGVALTAAVVLFPWFALLDQLAGRGAAMLCRLLHPVRHLEWLLAAGSAESPASIVERGATYLCFGAILATCSWLIAAWRLRRTGDVFSIKLAGMARRRRVRTVWDDPILWRERHDPGGRRIEILVGFVTVVSILALLSAVPDLRSRGIAHGLSEQTNGLLITMMLASVVSMGLRGAVTLADERKRRTLEPLFLADVEPIELIRSKLAAIFRPLKLLVPLVIVFAGVGYGERVGYLNPAPWLGAAAAALIVLSSCFLITSLTTACSAWMESPRTALVAGVGVLIAHTLGTILVGVGLAPLLPERLGLILATASPLIQFSVVQHAVTGHHSVLSVRTLLGVLAAELAVGLAALAAAAWRLEWHSRPTPPPRAKKQTSGKTAPLRVGDG